MEATLVQLFTSMECPQESDQLRTMLRKGGYPFREMDLTARPDIHTELLKRFGKQFTIPGILFNQQWFGWSSVPSSSTPALAAAATAAIDQNDNNVMTIELFKILSPDDDDDDDLNLVVEFAATDDTAVAKSNETTTTSTLFEQAWLETCVDMDFVVDPAAMENNTNNNNNHRNTTMNEEDCSLSWWNDGTMMVGVDHDSFVDWEEDLFSLIGGDGNKSTCHNNNINNNINNNNNLETTTQMGTTLTTKSTTRACRRNSASELLALMDDPTNDKKDDNINNNKHTSLMIPDISPCSTSTTSRTTNHDEDEEDNSTMSPSSSGMHNRRRDDHSYYYHHHPHRHHSGVMTTTHTTTTLPLIPLPNGTMVPVGVLTRLLLKVLSHAVTINPDTGKPVYSFRGQDGLELWSVLFFQPQEPPTQTNKTRNRCGEYNDSVLDHDVAVVSQGVPESTAAVMSFGHMLLERGILHNYTPHLQDFSNSFFVLRPLKELRVLNSFVQWPRHQKYKQQEVSATIKSTTPTANPSSQDKDPSKKDKGNSEEQEWEYPMSVILRLSRLMDDICNSTHNNNNNNNQGYNWPLFQEYEVACCQLQVLDFPRSKTERAAFLINLFNLIVRHAMVLASSSSSSSTTTSSSTCSTDGGGISASFVRSLWPTTMTSLQQDFFSQIGYTVGGVHMSLAYLQKCLYGTPRNDKGGIDAPASPFPEMALYEESPSSDGGSFGRRRNKSLSSRIRQLLSSPIASCCCSSTATVLEHGTNVCFTSPVICNDPRLLMATTWGTRSSPMVSTLYPDRLDEGLRTAVQSYVRTHVRIDTTPPQRQDQHRRRVQAKRGGRRRVVSGGGGGGGEGGIVILPTLLAWHRHDFGSEADRVLETILPYMSVEQLRQINHIKNETKGTLRVVFDGHFNWTPGINRHPQQQRQDQQPRQPQLTATIEEDEHEQEQEDTTLISQPQDLGELETSSLLSSRETASCFTSNVDEITTILERAPSFTYSTNRPMSPLPLSSSEADTPPLTFPTLEHQQAAMTPEVDPVNHVDDGIANPSTFVPSPPPQIRQTSSSSSYFRALFGRTSAPDASIGDDVALVPKRHNCSTTTNTTISTNTSPQQQNTASKPIQSADQVFPPPRQSTISTLPQTTYHNEQHTIHDWTETSNCDDISMSSNNNDARSVVFPCDVSEITYESEFRDHKKSTGRNNNRGIPALWRSSNPQDTTNA